MYNYNYNLKKKQLQYLQKKNKDYLLFCKYNDILTKQNQQFKIIFQKYNLSYSYIKQSIIPKNYNLKGHGSIVMIPFQTINQLPIVYKIINKISLLKPISLLCNKQILSSNKIQKIQTNKLQLPFQLKATINVLYRTLKLRQLLTADIT